MARHNSVKVCHGFRPGSAGSADMIGVYCRMSMESVLFRLVGRAVAPVAPGSLVSMVGRGYGPGWSGPDGQASESGQDPGEQVLSWRQSEGGLACVADQPGRNGQEPVAQGAQVAAAAAVAVVEAGEFLVTRQTG
jgi:hypothetical protein